MREFRILILFEVKWIAIDNSNNIFPLFYQLIMDRLFYKELCMGFLGALTF